MEIVNNIPFHHQDSFPGASDPILQSLEAYWNALRHARQIPSRNDIEPRAIDAALPHTFILQRISSGVARLRVAGQQLHDLLRMDARGMPIGTFFTPDARDDIIQIVETAFTEPAIISIPLVSPGADLTGTMLLLPLRDEKGQTTRILGAIVTQGSRGQRPCRFEIAHDLPIRHETLALRVASTQEAVLSQITKGPDATKHPALRLVVNNR
ncbi:PAS domain-containing protein [Loktanella sp. S4079]|uniref:PAS domain-containing protein n=1 Tax=Loktanella sp. S4079 TaxID=579483 RepID=UPI0005F9D78D|nr:PAS domain-containing protein [Loktanella sp. S4079]KJZ20140.1 hypothetical protein TW80_04705 [Loktanella sp. S4079]